MISVTTFIEKIFENIKRIKQYQLGHDGSDGLCDCIGLIIGAVRLAGEKWPWTHGTNYTARYLLDGGTLKGVPLHTGDLVFKAYKPGDKYYKLPSQYKNSEDLLDYYHVGVVVSAEPLIIKHCTQSSKAVHGIATDTERGNWLYSGWLKLVKKEEGDTMIGRVCAEKGKTVNMRKSPSAESAVIASISINSLVDIISKSGEWYEISYANKSGYMLEKFISIVSNEENAKIVYEANQLLNDVKTLINKVV